MTPQLVDLNGDGHQDVLVATFEGTAFLIAGSDEGWLKPTHIVDKSGTNVRISMYYDNEENDYASVDRSTDDYESNEDHHMTSVAAVDWDNDGDLDLILGAYEGGLYRCMNLGSNTEPEFEAKNHQVMIGGKPARMSSLTTPRVVDWDQDGRWDLLYGTTSGEIFWTQNTGTETEPKFKKQEKLLQVSRELKREMKLGGAKLTAIKGNVYFEAVDYDGDGDLDLLVGAHSEGEQIAEELTEKEKIELAELKKQAEAVEKQIAELFESVDSDEDAEEIYEDPNNEKLFEKSMNLFDKINEIQPYFEPPHLVWLFRNKGKEAELTESPKSAAEVPVADKG